MGKRAALSSGMCACNLLLRCPLCELGLVVVATLILAADHPKKSLVAETADGATEALYII
jgi:hypothetical protein